MSEKMTCEMPDNNPVNDEIVEIINNSKTIAIVGLSDNPERDSFKVGKYMQNNGYTVIPVNPVKDEILGEKSYASLKDIPVKVDIVDIFRKMEFIPEVVDEAIEIKAETVWMQLGLAHHVSAEKARKAGLKVVQSKCLKVEHAKM
jgi:uncharacterized protein